MNKWQSSLFDALHGLSAQAQIVDRVAWATTELGFDHFNCGVWAALPLSNPKLHAVGNLPQGFQARYSQMRRARHDPLTVHARSSNEPLVWGDAVFSDCPPLRADAQRHGVCHGWMQACVNAEGRRGLLTPSRHLPALGAEELRLKASDMLWLVQMTNLFIGPHAANQHDGSHTPISLTERETEVLRWAGDGKTIGEISSILAISDNTVNYYIKNAMAKLHAANKTAAVVIALTQGLLTY